MLLRSTLGRQALGCVFLVLLLLSGYLTYAVFTKKFVDVAWVDLETSRIGLQMSANADVKIRGVRVGEVREATSQGDGAVLKLAIDPEKLDTIPAGVTGVILPKTLFGEKFVSLEVPEGGGSRNLQSGDTITRAEQAIEVEQVLADLYPLLRTVQPEQLAYTLNALSTALEGRGEKIGDGLVRLDRYLKKLNPLVPGIVEDTRLLTEVSHNYADVMPELGQLLRNSIVTGETLRVKEQALEDFFTDVTSFSSTSRDFLDQNGENIIRLGEVSAPVLELLEEYSPVFPCLAKGLNNYSKKANESFRGYTLNINLETLPRQPTGYNPQDDPKYGADYGPNCLTLPNPPYDQDNLAPMPEFAKNQEGDDGVEGSHNKYRQAPMFDLTSGFAGTEREQHIVDAIAAPVLGVRPNEVPDLTTYLFAPLARGTEVSVR